MVQSSGGHSLETLEKGLARVQGVHCPGRNHDSIDIENEGTYITATRPSSSRIDLGGLLPLQRQQSSKI